MKTLLLICVLFVSFGENCNAQIIPDYPFKTFLDSANNLYITGYVQNDTKDILIKKFGNSQQTSWSITFIDPSGDDRGLDMAVDRQGNVFVTGYIFNNVTKSNDIIILKCNSTGIIWDSIISNPGDDKGLGIEVASDEYGFANMLLITGYKTNPTTGKDVFIKKLNPSDGSTVWENSFSSSYRDDVGTDIITDGYYAYVLGYSYMGTERLNDITLLTFDKARGSLEEVLFDNRPGSDEMPTGITFTQRSDNYAQKSRMAITSVTDEFNIFTGNKRQFLTMLLEPTSGTNQLNIAWFKKFINAPNTRTNVATSIASDAAGEVYVSGYANNDNYVRNNGLDFVTIKYKGTNGDYSWNPGVKFFNFSDTSTTGVDDKASSIKVNANNDVFVAGSCEGSPNGFTYIRYRQTKRNSVLDINRTFIPHFISESETRDERKLNKWATLHIASDGAPLMVVMGWNDTQADWAAIRYDVDGNVLYTINDEPEVTDNGLTSNNSKDESKKQNSSNTITSLRNYPNPFNPTTRISFNLPVSGNVTIKVYDALGNEVTNLTDGRMSEGTHSVTFDGNNLSSGIYYYTMSVDGRRTETKSMMLLK